MKDTQKIQMLTDALRDSCDSLEFTRNHSHNAPGWKSLPQIIAEGETVLAMVGDDGGFAEPEQLATLPEITPAMRAAGAIAAKFGLFSRLSISESVKAVQDIADIIAKTHNAREASKNAR